MIFLNHNLSSRNTDPIASWDRVSAHKPVRVGIYSQANDQGVSTNHISRSNQVTTLRRKVVILNKSNVGQSAPKPVGAGLPSQTNGQIEVANRDVLKGMEKQMKYS
ncbi:hypothetical protein Tco_0562209 [Tanacetum coccineum]